MADGRSGLRQDHSPEIKETEKNWGAFIVRIFCYVNMSVMLKDDERGYKKRPPGGPECPGGKEGVGAQLLT